MFWRSKMAPAGPGLTFPTSCRGLAPVKISRASARGAVPLLPDPRLFESPADPGRLVLVRLQPVAPQLIARVLEPPAVREFSSEHGCRGLRLLGISECQIRIG